MRQSVRRGAGLLATVAMGVALAGVGVAGPSGAATTRTASAPGVTPSTITLGFITSVTGIASSGFSDGAGGAQARIALQNARGGVDGRKLKLVSKDDASSPTQGLAAGQNFANGGVFGVMEDSAFSFVGTTPLSKAGVPVTGFAFDGPEWIEPGSTNMFSFVPPYPASKFNGSLYNYDYFGPFAKQIGITKLAGLAYGISPSAIGALQGELTSAKLHGISTCYENLTVPFGGVDFTADALQIKAGGCNGVTAPFVDSSDVALSQAVKNAGIKAKQIYNTGYDQSVLSDPSAAAAYNGDYLTNPVNFTTPNKATKAMLAALSKYDPSYKGGVPDFGTWVAYVATDLMIRGLQLAGANPTQPSFISHLHKVNNYNAGGILPAATPFSLKDFGKLSMLPARYCQYFIQVSNGKFVSTNGGKPYCGARMKVTSS